MVARRAGGRLFFVGGLFAAGLLAAAAAYVYVNASRGLSQARALAAEGKWSDARAALARFRRIHPRDERAMLLAAEILVRDETLGPEAINEALDLLRRIPDRSPFAVQARTQEGRVLLFVLHQAGRAERAFRSAMELEHHAVESRYLLWKLYDLTGRSHLAESLFWSVYELTPEEQRPMRLREWYMSQFFPATANPDLDQLMGILAEGEEPSAKTEYNRFLDFRNHEPDMAIGHAGLARWFNLEGDPKFALQLLTEAEPKLAAEQKLQPYFLASKIANLIDLGQFDEAEACLKQWPEPRSGYEFWKWQAIILDEVQGKYEEALQSYDRALGVWPGAADWRTRFRKAECLRRAGRVEDADREQARARAVESLMEDAVHARVRAALGNLANPAGLLVVAEFYRDLGRPREAASWLQLSLRGRPGTGAAGESAAPQTAVPPDGKP